MNTPMLGTILAELAGAPTAHRTVLTGGPVTLSIAATTRQPLAALIAATVPYLEPATSGRHDSPAVAAAEQIRIHTGHGMTGRLRRLTDRPHVTIGGVHLVRAAAGEGEHHRQAYLLWDQKAPRTSHLLLDRSGPATDKVTLRLVRGIASRTLIRAGWVPLHAAAAATANGLLVLAGQSGAGKTTTLLHLLSAGLGHALVANDKTYLHGNPDGLYCRALPTSLALRPDTFAAFHVITRAENGHVDNYQRRVAPDGRLQVTPQSLAGNLGLPLHPGGRVAAIAILSRAPDSAYQWSRVAPEHVLAAVASAYLTDWFIDEPHEHARLQAPAASIRAGHHRALRHIAAAVPVIELRTGTAVPQALEAILTELR